MHGQRPIGVRQRYRKHRCGLAHRPIAFVQLDRLALIKLSKQGGLAWKFQEEDAKEKEPRRTLSPAYVSSMSSIISCYLKLGSAKKRRYNRTTSMTCLVVSLLVK